MGDQETAAVKTGDGVTLTRYRWEADSPRLELILVHGYGEHAGRYEWTARHWAGRGITTTAVDLRGHGRSPGARGYVRVFEDYHLDLKALMDSVPSDRPRAIFGHSLGGLIVVHWLMKNRSHSFRSAVVSSPLFEVAVPLSPLKITLGRAVARVWPKFSMATGIAGRDVCRDPNLSRSYDSDPLNNRVGTVGWFVEAERAMGEARSAGPDLRLPLLLMYAGDDRVASPEANQRFGATLRPPSRSERVDGAYHELLNEPEPERTRYADRMADWLIQHVDG